MTEPIIHIPRILFLGFLFRLIIYLFISCGVRILLLTKNICGTKRHRVAPKSTYRHRISPCFTPCFIFPNGRITENAVSNACRRRSKEAGIKRTSIHEIRRTVSSYLNTVLPREAVANMLGHLPTTNERFYDYDISSRSVKVEALEKLSDNVIKFSDYSKTDKSRKVQ